MYTPGPWVAISSNVRWTRSDERPLFDNGIWHIMPEYDLERLPICTVDKGDDHHAPTREHAEVDARLISAAPEMLEALKAMIDGRVKGPIAHAVHPSGMFCTVCGLNSEEQVHCDNCPVYLAEKAIAKAEGRQ